MLSLLQVDQSPTLSGNKFRNQMKKVLSLVEQAEQSLSPDTVHDLRVAIRRCRSIGTEFSALDCHPDWESMNHIGRKLFQKLGGLRDCQVMCQLIQSIAKSNQLDCEVLSASLESERVHSVERACKGLRKFDRTRWEECLQTLPIRREMVPSGDLAYELVAVERYQQLHVAHRQALRNRSAPSWHELRIAVKKFRYVLENFLPHWSLKFGDELKLVQDYLGDVHDLDILKGRIKSRNTKLPTAEKNRWYAVIGELRREHLVGYRTLTMGADGAMPRWEQALPDDARMAQVRLAWQMAYDLLQSQSLFF